MKLLSVNVSPVKEVLDGDRTVTTGIFKRPAAGRVMLRRLGLDGDEQANRAVHGGVDKAAYAYPFEHYAHWKHELGRDDFTFGQLGENFTVEGLLEDEVRLGDVLRIGGAGAIVEVTQPRVPCHMLGLKMRSAEFPKILLKSGRTGFYLRVRAEGEVGAGDTIERIEAGTTGFTVREMSHLMHFDPDNVGDAKRALRITWLSPEWRRRLEERVAKADVSIEEAQEP